ncbi:uncharacterized protein UV8b_02356 [Ustilaginoidea virens]|uniref:Uncharacterized protein n=1 Tax=Ustilaginoidea virens TaxID=1159556 RepID=A0A8E5HMC1_USTVR|nr:uncharacterized protein UV8b_02356 [Ustilaginoidea virens]QUC18115.1 hypothetical protein UV8b_02356 [Ustilaginoidea virens]
MGGASDQWTSLYGVDRVLINFDVRQSQAGNGAADSEHALLDSSNPKPDQDQALIFCARAYSNRKKRRGTRSKHRASHLPGLGVRPSRSWSHMFGNWPPNSVSAPPHPATDASEGNLRSVAPVGS